MTFNKQVRLYLIEFPRDRQNLLCPAQSAEHVKSMLGKIDNAEVYYLGWTEISRQKEHYQVADFIAQENGDVLTGKEINTFQKNANTFPQLIDQIVSFLDEYYYEERIDRLETELQNFRAELAFFKKFCEEKQNDKKTTNLFTN